MGIDVDKKYRDRQDLVALANPQWGVDDLKDQFIDTEPIPGVARGGGSYAPHRHAERLSMPPTERHLRHGTSRAWPAAKYPGMSMSVQVILPARGRDAPAQLPGANRIDHDRVVIVTMPSVGGVMVRLAGKRDADPNSHLRLCQGGPTV
jgi:hypothetical protein